MLLITFEGLSSRTTNQLFVRLKRRLHNSVDVSPIDPVTQTCPFVKIQRLLTALSAAPEGCEAVLSPISFYSFAPNRAIYVEYVNAMQAVMRTNVDFHLMFVLVSEPQELLDEYLDRGSVATIEDIERDNALAIETAKCPVGHPWRAGSYIIEVDRFTLDTPTLLETVATNIHNIVLKTRERMRKRISVPARGEA